jgi:K+/H+ antiporter YhaU regulatory subunit KhtT
MTLVNETPRIDLTTGDAIAISVLENDDDTRVYLTAYDADHDTVAAVELTADEAVIAGQLLTDAASEARRGAAGS